MLIWNDLKVCERLIIFTLTTLSPPSPPPKIMNPKILMKLYLCIQMGEKLMAGRGVPQNNSEAMQWFRSTPFLFGRFFLKSWFQFYLQIKTINVLYLNCLDSFFIGISLNAPFYNDIPWVIKLFQLGSRFSGLQLTIVLSTSILKSLQKTHFLNSLAYFL